MGPNKALTRTTLLLLVFLLSALWAMPAQAMPQQIESTFFGEPDPQGIIVRFAPRAEFDVAQRGVAHLRAGAARERGLRGMPAYDLVMVPEGSSADAVLRRYQLDPAVLYAEPNYPVSIERLPNDSRFAEQWGLHNTGQVGGTPGADIDASGAWDVVTGGRDVIVAVIDTGVDYRHPDLAANMWPAIGESFVDLSGDPMDYHGHGTHVAGTIAAVGDDGYGVAGVAWEAQIMALKALDDNGSGWSADIAEAVTYASNHGAHVINMSLGGGSFSQTFYDAIAASDALVVIAAGNSGQDTDTSPTYPASYDLDNIVAVAATDRTDTLASFSNYGLTSVDLGAPGVAILSAEPGHTYTATTVFNDPIDTLDKWSTDSYSYKPWALNSAYSTSPSYSAAHAPAGGIVVDEQSWIYARDYVSLVGAESMEVRFNARLDINSGDDGLLVAALPEGGHWVGLGYIDSATGGSFRSYRVENSTLAGKNVRLAFILFGGAKGGGAGVWVDDVKIEALMLDGGTDFEDAHVYMSGTSMAAPHVAGAAALLKAYSPDLDHAGLKAALLDTAKPLPSLEGKTVTGGRLDAAAALAVVEPPNSVPVAVGDAYVAEAGVTLTVAAPGVLANDTDADGDVLTAELVTGVAEGGLSLGAEGSFSYTPPQGFVGEKSFTYRAFDGIDYSDPATVTIGVADTTAPTSTATLDSATPAGLHDWYTTAPAVSIEATDTGSGVDYIEWSFVGGAWQREQEASVTLTGVEDGDHVFSYRAADLAGNIEATRTVELKVDTTAPVTTSDATDTYEKTATIALDAQDTISGVAGTFYRLGDGVATPYTGPIVVDELGEHTLVFWSVDVAGNTEAEQTVTFSVADTTVPPSTVTLDPDALPSIIKGDNRYLTAIAGSKAAYPDGALAVVIVTGENFADALGGAGLAGALDSPMLLVERNALPGAVAAEIRNLGATEAYILGGTSAVSDAVAAAVKNNLAGTRRIERLQGNDRYQTASRVAAKAIEVLNASGTYSGDAFIPTGANFPDALGASPVAASQGMPVFLADPARTTVPLPSSVKRVWITGGTAVVSPQKEAALKTSLGTANVKRLAGANRFDTAARVAAFGVSRGMAWEGVGITTGMNFPDALAAGPVLGSRDAVMLLTDTSAVPQHTRTALTTNKAQISRVTFFGGDAAVPLSVRTAVNGHIK